MLSKNLSQNQKESLLKILEDRFERNLKRHPDMKWLEIKSRLEKMPEKLWALQQMEETGGEPDVVAYYEESDEFVFCDCSAESPAGRRSICYDQEALESRKKFKPEHSAVGMAAEMGIELLSAEQYHQLQQLGPFDTKTSSWLKTPPAMRKLGGAIFGDWRYGSVFVYHNGAESYYGARGFRGALRV
jgi:hypothetical protein